MNLVNVVKGFFEGVNDDNWIDAENKAADYLMDTQNWEYEDSLKFIDKVLTGKIK